MLSNVEPVVNSRVNLAQTGTSVLVYVGQFIVLWSCMNGPMIYGCCAATCGSTLQSLDLLSSCSLCCDAHLGCNERRYELYRLIVYGKITSTIYLA